MVPIRHNGDIPLINLLRSGNFFSMSKWISWDFDMCMVIDANVFCSFFRTDAPDHSEFAPALKWVTKGQGFLVYGGTKYKQELTCAPKYFQLFIELKNKNRVKEINCALVDQHQRCVASLAENSCDDPHIIAIFRVSGCRIFCSNDKRSFEHIKNKKLYLKGQKIPLIYRKRKNMNLLCGNNIIAVRNVT